LANNLPKDVMRIFDSATVKRTPAERSFRWILNRPEIAVVLSGMNSIEQIEENCTTASDALPGAVTEEELAVIASVKQKYAEKIKVPCTGCRYCMPCPFRVNIPECFAAYNNYHMFNRNFTNKLQYLARMGGVLSDRSYAGLCRKCGKCKIACPQGIDIPKELAKVSSDMEGLTFRLQIFLMKLVMPLQAKLAMLGRKKKN
ncbi:MAG: 4Fe-4S dicluster domain-containing protein, partial [Methanomicrobium sp.]|nr:4Fe-4S dicluster domain-containing protein [Methanomicrobium sp.]